MNEVLAHTRIHHVTHSNSTYCCYQLSSTTRLANATLLGGEKTPLGIRPGAPSGVYPYRAQHDEEVIPPKRLHDEMPRVKSEQGTCPGEKQK